MLNKDYQETIHWLFNQFPSYQNIGAKAYKPDLTNCRLLSELIGFSQNKLKFIHIAGTNGKGSTSSMIASILTENNLKVGLFTSPHIHDFRERIRINGSMISESFVVDFCDKIKKLKIDFEPSFFEITWMMALSFFHQQECDICIIETGLGGRLDATNIITPILSIITNIGLEHTNFLGETYEEIAIEKAGIIKPNVPVIIGETLPETKSVFETIAENNTSQIIFSENFEIKIPEYFPLLGAYQRNNYKSVIKAIEYLNSLEYQISEKSIEKGLKNISKNTGFFGRLQVINQSPLTILDVSHNYEGIRATLESLKSTAKGKLHLIYGTSSDKDIHKIFSLFDNENEYYFTEFNNLRSAKIYDLEVEAKKHSLKAKYFHNINSAFKSAQESVNKEDTILIFGSFFLVSDFF